MVRHIVVLALTLAAGAGVAPGSAFAQSITIDDFGTGRHRARLTATEHDLHVQRGSMVGGFRHSHFFISHNVLGRPAMLEIGKPGRVVVEGGARVFQRLELTYGVDAGGAADPLNLDLSAADRFRVHFDTTDLALNVNVVVFSGGTIMSLGRNVPAPPGGGPFQVDFPFAEFASSGPLAFDDVDHIVLVIQSANTTGGEDYVLSSLEASQP